MRIKRLLSLSLACILSIALFVGCGNSKSNDNGSDLKEVDVVLDWYPNAIHSFIYAAIEKGYYKEEGLNVNIRFPSNPTDPLALPAAGKATVGIYYLQDVIMAKANENVPVKSLGAIVQSPLNIVMSLEKSGIKEPKDLAGKTIGYSGNPLSEEIIKTLLKESGCDPNSVKIVDVGFDLMASLTTGNVDATIGAMLNHEVPVMEKEGFKVNYFTPNQYGVPNYYELIFVAGEKTINEDQETLDKFLKASTKGFDFVKKNPDEALKIMLNNQNKENFPLDADVEKQSLDMLIPLMSSKNSAFLSQNEEVFKENIDWLKKQGLLKNEIKAEDILSK